MLAEKGMGMTLMGMKRPSLKELQTIFERMPCCHHLYHAEYA